MTDDSHPGPGWFKDIMGHYPTGVTVVTATDPEGNPVGLTANSVTSVSLDPPLVLVCLSKDSSSLGAILDSGAFAVNILDAGGGWIATQFATGERERRFEGVGYTTNSGTSPVLDGVLAWLACTLYKTFEAGDHLILVGRVQSGGAEGGDPLLYFQGRYGRLTR